MSVGAAPIARSEYIQKPIRVALANDHPIVRYGLRELLTLEEDIVVVGEAVSGPEAVEVVTATNADILIVDLGSATSRAWGLLELLRRAGNLVKTIALTDSENRNDFVRAMKLGCSGIVLKQTATQEMVTCIRSVHAGGIWLDRFATENSGTTYKNAGQPPLFSRREREILALLAHGYTNPQIAAKLFLSPQTIKNHLHHMYVKIGRKDRHQLAFYAIHQGLYRAIKSRAQLVGQGGGRGRDGDDPKGD
jgi:DNA-binding NarL/FixJ family response regulator